MERHRIVGYVDQNGEIHEGVVPVLCGTKLQSPYGDRWMQFNQEFLTELAARRDLGNQALRVFIYLNGRLDFQNVIQVEQTEIAQVLGMQKQNVNQAIKRLEEFGIIIRGPKVGRSSSWKLNPMAGWKGKISHLRTAQANHLRLVSGGKEKTEPAQTDPASTEPAQTDPASTEPASTESAA